MPVSGVGAYLALGIGSPLTDVSGYLDSVQGSDDTEELDGTTFQPNVANPLKTIVPGFSTQGFSLSGKYTHTAHTFFRSIKGSQNVSYEYGPEGTGSGALKIYGLCSCTSYSGPQSSVDAITAFNAELRVSSQTDGTF